MSYRTHSTEKTNAAVRVVPSAKREREYPCVFKFEITDNRLVTRLQDRLATDQRVQNELAKAAADGSTPSEEAANHVFLTPRQKAWYDARINFRDLTVA